MGRKYLIVVVFASLVQCSLTLPATDTDELSDRDSAKLSQIIILQNKAWQSAKGSINPIFDVNEDYSYTLFGDFETTVENSATRIAEANANARATVDAAFDAIPLALGGPCAAIEQARKAAHGKVDQMHALATKGWELGVTRNYSATQDQIQIYEVEAQNSYRDLTDNFCDLLRTCTNSRNPIVLAVIENFQKSVGLGLRHVVSAFFSASKLYATADTAKRSLISVSRDLRNQGVVGYRDALESTFALLRALALVRSSIEYNTKQLPAVFAIQYAQIVTASRLQGTVAPIFGEHIAGMQKVSLKIDKHNVNDFCLTDAARAIATARGISASDSYFDSAIAAKPNISEEVVPVKETFAKLVPTMINNFFEAIDIARDSGINYPESSEKIGTIRESQLSHVDAFVDTIFELFQIDGSLDSDTEARLATIKNATSNAAHAYINSIFNSTDRLAKNVEVGEVREEDLAAISSDQAMTNSAIEELASSVSEAELLLLNST